MEHIPVTFYGVNERESRTLDVVCNPFTFLNNNLKI